MKLSQEHKAKTSYYIKKNCMICFHEDPVLLKPCMGVASHESHRLLECALC